MSVSTQAAIGLAVKANVKAASAASSPLLLQQQQPASSSSSINSMANINLGSSNTTTISNGTNRNTSKILNNNNENMPTTSNNTENEEDFITINPFINDFIDCMEFLPNKLQKIATQIRNVDSLVTGWLFALCYLFYFHF